jgi:hypothetical protein
VWFTNKGTIKNYPLWHQGDISNGILDILDISGNIIHSKSLERKNDEFYINTSRFTSGLYFVRINTQNESINEKFIVVK